MIVLVSPLQYLQKLMIFLIFVLKKSALNITYYNWKFDDSATVKTRKLEIEMLWLQKRYLKF